MKKVLQKVFLCLCVVLMCSSIVLLPEKTYGASEDIFDEKPFHSVGYGTARYFDYLVFDGQRVALYPVYEDKASALDNFKAENSEFLDTLKTEYKLPSINVGNVEDYVEAGYRYIEKMHAVDGQYPGFENMTYFWDIYENDGANEDIYTYLRENGYLLSEAVDTRGLKTVTASLAQTRNYSDENDAILSESNLRIGLKCIVPYNCGLFNYYVEDNENNNRPASRASLWDVGDAVNYAEAHATSRNTSDYYNYSKDCTNFVSQILEAGHIAQRDTGNKSTGWWHWKVWYYPGHESSDSWSVVGPFVNFWGLKMTTLYHLPFSANLHQGDVITFDKNGDGSWDHLGFVTRIDGCGLATKNGKSFYDYRVAQHTTDYLLWASDYDNGWSEIQNGRNVYGIVSRILPI